MELIEPWRTRIGRVNLKDRCDLEAVASEVLALHHLTPEGDEKPYPATASEFPAVIGLRDNVITPLVVEFFKQEFNHDYQDVRVESFGRWLSEGKSLGAHYHGSSAVTCILYPEDYDSEIVVYDPRGNACRGYPRQVRDSCFGDFKIYPKAGDLVILPSYLMHYVPTVRDTMRLTLVNDYYIELL